MRHEIVKAEMRPIERYAVIGAIIAGCAGVGLVGAHTQGTDGVLYAMLAAAAVIAILLQPGGHLIYWANGEQLHLGRLTVSLAEILSVRRVPLAGMMVYAGLVLPGYWVGRAWLPSVGRVRLRASTGVGHGVLILTRSGERVLFTPEHPTETIVLLQALLRRQRRVGQKEEPPSAGGPGSAKLRMFGLP